MAVSATMSLLGLYNYDETIFDNLQLPEELDSTILVDNLLMDAASLEVLYPDPLFLKEAIGRWSAKRVGVWEELYATTQYEYNPIDNYDRHEEWTETEEGSGTDSLETSGSGSSSGSSSTSSSSESTATASATAYNSDTFKDTGKNVGESEGSTSASSSTETTDSGTSEREYGHSVTREHTAHLRGNIGVTTTMQMIAEQRDTVKFNLYEIIEEEFISRFLLPVY